MAASASKLLLNYSTMVFLMYLDPYANGLKSGVPSFGVPAFRVVMIEAFRWIRYEASGLKSSSQRKILEEPYPPPNSHQTSKTLAEAFHEDWLFTRADCMLYG